MKKAIRNFWLNVALYLLLAANIALVSLTPSMAAGTEPGFGWHIHALLGILTTIGCLMHITMHWQWFRAVLSGKAKGRVKLGMIAMVTLMTLLAVLSGHEVMTSASATGFHSFTGYAALIGLSIHSVKRIPWMVATTRRLANGGRPEVITQVA